MDKADTGNDNVVEIHPNSFQYDVHYYPKVMDSTLSDKLQSFLQMDNDCIVKHYCRLYGRTDATELLKLLQSLPVFFQWSGGDLFHVMDRYDDDQAEKMVLIEINSCPSGQKSMPNRDQNGYHDLMRRMFRPLILSTDNQGQLAVLYDKNMMETRAYAEALADVMNENVFYVKFDDTSSATANVKFVDRQLFVRDHQQQWHLIRAAFRYVTQKPWNRIPLDTRTLIINPIVACLAGGRNKMLASHAYQLFNEKYAKYGIEIRTPTTITNVQKEEIPECIKRLDGMGVIKIPYLNAGQGIYTIVNAEELERFMTVIPTSAYHSYIVQSLVGHAAWSTTKKHRYYHIGTKPDEKGDSYVKDLRMQICSSVDGFRPTSVYCRRARLGLSGDRNSVVDSWQILGTNLSVKKNQAEKTGGDTSEWTTESERLIIMDHNDHSGLHIDNLIDAYVQTVLGTLAIDQLAQQLIDKNGTFDMNLFKSLNLDDELIQEILL